MKLWTQESTAVFYSPLPSPPTNIPPASLSKYSDAEYRSNTRILIDFKSSQQQAGLIATHTNKPVWHQTDLSHVTETNKNHVRFAQLFLDKSLAPLPAHSSPERAELDFHCTGSHWLLSLSPQDCLGNGVPHQDYRHCLLQSGSPFCRGGPRVLLLPRTALPESGLGEKPLPGQCGTWRMEGRSPGPSGAEAQPWCQCGDRSSHAPAMPRYRLPPGLASGQR